MYIHIKHICYEILTSSYDKIDFFEFSFGVVRKYALKIFDSPQNILLIFFNIYTSLLAVFQAIYRINNTLMYNLIYTYIRVLIFMCIYAIEYI